MNSPLPLELDVRPMFAAGRGPLPAILATVSQLAPGQALRLIAPMEPKPLYELLAARGFAAQPQAREDGSWEILFVPEPEA